MVIGKINFMTYSLVPILMPVYNAEKYPAVLSNGAMS